TATAHTAGPAEALSFSGQSSSIRVGEESCARSSHGTAERAGRRYPRSVASVHRAHGAVTPRPASVLPFTHGPHLGRRGPRARYAPSSLRQARRDSAGNCAPESLPPAAREQSLDRQDVAARSARTRADPRDRATT